MWSHIAFVSFAVFLSVVAVKGDRLSKTEIEDLKKRLAVVRDETVKEVRNIADVRRKDILDEKSTSCISDAAKELEDGVMKELDSRIGSLEKELQDGKVLDRDLLKRKVETATVGAGVAVERRTTAFIKKAFSCTRKEFGNISEHQDD